MRFGFEGGQMPLIRRQPKLGGFKTPGRITYEVVNLYTLEEKLSDGTYDVAALKAHDLVHGKGKVKILGEGTITKKLSLTVHAASKSATKAIEKAGGSVTIL
jgi:large subunit ribosomal protein L15